MPSQHVQQLLNTVAILVQKEHIRHVSVKKKIQATLTEDMQQQKQVVEVHNPNAVNNKDFLSVTEASQLIGVSRWTIQRMIQQGRLKAVPFGRKRIVARWQIENLFN